MLQPLHDSCKVLDATTCFSIDRSSISSGSLSDIQPPPLALSIPNRAASCRIREGRCLCLRTPLLMPTLVMYLVALLAPEELHEWFLDRAVELFGLITTCKPRRPFILSQIRRKLHCTGDRKPSTGLYIVPKGLFIVQTWFGLPTDKETSALSKL